MFTYVICSWISILFIRSKYGEYLCKLLGGFTFFSIFNIYNIPHKLLKVYNKNLVTKVFSSNIWWKADNNHAKVVFKTIRSVLNL